MRKTLLFILIFLSLLSSMSFANNDFKISTDVMKTIQEDRELKSAVAVVENVLNLWIKKDFKAAEAYFLHWEEDERFYPYSKVEVDKIEFAYFLTSPFYKNLIHVDVKMRIYDKDGRPSGGSHYIFELENKNGVWKIARLTFAQEPVVEIPLFDKQE